MQIDLSTYHADNAHQHFNAGRLHEARRCALVSGYLASRRGDPCKPPDWMIPDSAYFAVGGFWVASWKGHRDFLRDVRAKQRRQEARDHLAVADLFPHDRS